MTISVTREILTSDPHIVKLSSPDEILIYKLFIQPIIRKHIIAVLVEGESGSGKSMLSLLLAWMIEHVYNKLYGWNEPFDPEAQVVYTPGEYAEKLDAWVKSPQRVLMIDELRFLVPKQAWQTLLNQSIAEVNAVIRSVKSKNSKYKHSGVLIYNTQDIGDISKDVRKTITYDIRVTRSVAGSAVKARIYKLWTSSYDVEKPKILIRRAHFRVGNTDFVVNGVFPSLPPRDVRKAFLEKSAEKKGEILRRKREIIMREIRKDMNDGRDFVEELRQEEIFEMVKGMARFRGGKITFSPEKRRIIMKMFDISGREFRNKFIPAVLEAARERGLLPRDEKKDGSGGV